MNVNNITSNPKGKRQKRDLDIRAVFWVKHLSIEKSLKAVMYGLAVESNRHEGHTCFPGQKLIAENAGVKVRTVRDAIKELTGMGLIKVEPRRTKFGSNSYLYTLNLPATTAGSDETQPAKSVNPTGKICTKTPIQPAAIAYEGKAVLKKKKKQKEEIAETANGTLKTITKKQEEKPLLEEEKITPDLSNAIKAGIDLNCIDSIPDLWVQFCKESNWLATMTNMKRYQLKTAAKKIEELGLSPGDVMRTVIKKWGGGSHPICPITLKCSISLIAPTWGSSSMVWMRPLTFTVKCR